MTIQSIGLIKTGSTQSGRLPIQTLNLLVGGLYEA